MIDKIVQTTIEIPEDFISKIYEVKESSDPIRLRSNVNGWQSKQYDSLSEIPWITEFFTSCLEKLNLTHLEVQHIWFNINPKGAFHTWHSHDGSKQVGVCYIQVPKNSGNIQFQYKTGNSQIEPNAGMIITFPGGLKHQVLMNNSTEDRITLAFNLQNKG